MGQQYEAWARGRIRYFNKRFGAKLARELKGTPFPVSMVIGIAIEETGYVWNAFENRQLSDSEFFELCVADSYGWGRRSHWPKTKAQLLAVPRGQEVFNALRAALEKRAALVGGSTATYARNPENIMMACGPWQYDLGFVRWAGPDFFAEKKWHSLKECMKVFTKEIEDRRKRLKISPNNMTRHEMALIATAYNTGWSGFKPARGLNQGNVTQGRPYGLRVYDFIGYARDILGDSYPDKRQRLSA